jgi:hypothetical protein
MREAIAGTPDPLSERREERVVSRAKKQKQG